MRFSRKTIAPLSSKPINCSSVLACINANGASDDNIRFPGHGDVLLVLLSPHQKPLGQGARLVHPTLGHFLRCMVSLFPDLFS